MAHADDAEARLAEDIEIALHAEGQSTTRAFAAKIANRLRQKGWC